MYSRIKSTFLSHFHKPSQADLTKEDLKKLRHSLAECQLSDSAPQYSHRHQQQQQDPLMAASHHWSLDIGHAPLAPAEEEDDVYYATNKKKKKKKKKKRTTTSTTSINQSTVDNQNQTIYSQFTGNFDGDDDSDDYIDSIHQGAADDEDDSKDPIMPHFALSWNIQYLGSFPISNLSADYIGQRLERFQPTTPPQSIELSVSLIGVRVCCEETVLMSHSLRRVCSVVGRPSFRQVAYIALEPAGRTYRRLCHVFQARDINQIEQIESVLGQAFNAQTLTKPSSNTIQKSSTPVVSGTTLKTPKKSTSTMNEKRSASTVFLNRFLGKKGSQTVDEASSCKRKRRPVSAVFSSAIHRLSSSTTSMHPKRMTTTDLIKDPTTPHRSSSSPVAEEPAARNNAAVTGGSLTSGSTSTSSGSDIENQPATLIFEEKLGEWIYPIDSTITAQLENCNYFVGLPSRECLTRNLMSQQEGAFVIRYSESKKKCLALSMRVPLAHNPTGISHYLIIRNEHGFRLKFSGSNKPFPSLQMLLTHHSVLEGNLPCTLYFVQWDKNLWKQQPPHQSSTTNDKSIHRHQNRHSTALTKIDENRNLTSLANSSILLNARRCGIDDFSTPKRRSRHDLNSIRRSHFFDLDQRIVS